MIWFMAPPSSTPAGPLWKRVRHGWKSFWKRLGHRRRSQVRPVTNDRASLSSGGDRRSSGDATGTPGGSRRSSGDGAGATHRLSVTLPAPLTGPEGV
jgi:hypothetical protein